MTKHAKIFLIIMVILLIGIASFSIYFFIQNQTEKKQESKRVEVENNVNILSDGTKVNESKKIREDKKIEGLDITKIELTGSGQVTKLTGMITNNTKKSRGDFIAEIILVDSNEKELCKMETYIKKLEPNESTTLNSSIIFDYADAYNIIFRKK